MTDSQKESTEGKAKAKGDKFSPITSTWVGSCGHIVDLVDDGSAAYERGLDLLLTKGCDACRQQHKKNVEIIRASMKKRKSFEMETVIVIRKVGSGNWRTTLCSPSVIAFSENEDLFGSLMCAVKKASDLRGYMGMVIRRKFCKKAYQEDVIAKVIEEGEADNSLRWRRYAALKFRKAFETARRMIESHVGFSLDEIPPSPDLESDGSEDEVITEVIDEQVA